MKKYYVLAAATVLAVSASAAGVQKRVMEVKPAKPIANVQLSKVNGGVLAEANHSVKAAKKAQPVKGEAFYRRPAGGFYSAWSEANSGFLSPYINVKPFSPVTFVAQESDAYNWKVQLYNPELGDREYLTAQGKEITVEYIQETDEVPVLSNGQTEYFISGWNSAGATTQAHIASNDDFIDWTDGVYLSPKYVCGDRDAGGGAQFRAYSGAADAEGGKTGFWFGHNKAGWDAMGMYVEKPENPYLLRSVMISYGYLDLAAPEANIYVDVYKVASRVAEDEHNKDVQFGEKICSGVGTFVKGEAEQEGNLVVSFFEEIDGLEMEVTPTIEDEIIIVISGYGSDAFNTFSMYISTDQWDEGYGQHGYMIGGFAEDDAKMVIGLDHFFSGAPFNITAPSVFLNVANPFMLFYYNVEDGVRTFDKEGNCTTTFTVTGYPYDMNVISLYSVSSGEEMTFTLEDGSDLPEWLTIEAEDVEDEEGFTGQVLLTVKCDANAGAAREANVKVAIPGASIPVIVKQEGDGAPDVKGDVNGDGVVDIADVNAAIDMVLGLTDNKPAADVNGDGVVDIADINAIIDIVLGL